MRGLQSLFKIWSAFPKAQEIGCDFVVTGHYARIKYDETKGRYLLLKAVDPKKTKVTCSTVFLKNS